MFTYNWETVHKMNIFWALRSEILDLETSFIYILISTFRFSYFSIRFFRFLYLKGKIANLGHFGLFCILRSAKMQTKGFFMPSSGPPLSNWIRQIINWESMWVQLVGKMKLGAHNCSKPEYQPKMAFFGIRVYFLPFFPKTT